MKKSFRLIDGCGACGREPHGGRAPPLPPPTACGSANSPAMSPAAGALSSARPKICTAHSRGNGHREHYVGSISKFGVDIGYTEGGVLVWGVFAPSSDVREGALQGDYAGASAQATVGLGVGANVLVGGLDKSIALQPLSVEGSKGLNVAAGIGAISLRSAP